MNKLIRTNKWNQTDHQVPRVAYKDTKKTEQKQWNPIIDR